MALNGKIFIIFQELKWQTLREIFSFETFSNSYVNSLKLWINGMKNKSNVTQLNWITYGL